MTWFLTLFFSVLFSSCKAPGALGPSELSGAASVGSALLSLSAIKNQLDVPPAEWTPSQAMMISSTLITLDSNYTEGMKPEHSKAMIQGILDSGVDLWVLNQGKDIDVLRQILEGWNLGNIKDRIHFFADNFSRSSSSTVMRDPNLAFPFLRDMIPIITRSHLSSNRPLILFDFNLYHKEAPSGLIEKVIAYANEGKERKVRNQLIFDDAAPETLAQSRQDMARVEVPLFFEGGNFITDGQGHCFMTDYVLKRNQQNSALLEAYRDSLMAVGRNVSGGEIFNPAKIESFFRDYVGCTNVTIIPLQIKDPENVSKEEEDKNKQREFLLAGFYHIDLWAKFLDSNTLLMPEFSEEQIEELPYDHDREKIRILNQFLADAEDKILKAKSGLTVSRLNVPLSYTKRSRIEEDRFVHPSYINSALIVGSEKRIALVPRFNQGTDLKYRDYQLFPAMEKKVRETFEEAGYEVVWVDSDPFPQFHSGIHCLTRNIPKI